VTRTIAARARIANPEGKLRPGLFARVSAPLSNGAPVLSVPETTLVPEGSKMMAFRIVEGKAQRVDVKMGQRNNGMIEIVGGLNEGDTVVVTGQMRVQDGKSVNVVSTIAPPVTPVSAVTTTIDLQPAPEPVPVE
jgi:membrane fusion protein (multidrug efflux system)